MKTIYELGLHETIFIPEGDIRILRVPGGWIYSCIRNNIVTSTFVPKHTEFLERDKQDEKC